MLVIENAKVITPTGVRARRGAAMGELQRLDDATIVIDGSIIQEVTTGPVAIPPGARRIDAASRIVTPGFVDSHTHLIFAGERSHEFVRRLQGASYMDIMREGGGIQATVNPTRAATAEELAALARPWTFKMAAMGVTTVEAKSGYGLDTASELRMLDAIAILNADPEVPVDIVPTFMGAHAVPKEYKDRTSEYVDLLCLEMIPAAKGKADFCDVFCEKDVFELDDTRRILEVARRHGFKLKLHADEIMTLGGSELGAEMGCTSVDHLLHISDQGVNALANSDTIATLLPITAFVLRDQYAPARRLIDAGAAVALATDFNPGSCFSCSTPLMMALAGLYMKMTPEETLTALTLNGAAAVGRAHDRGSIEPGKRADLCILDCPSLDYIHYNTAINQVSSTLSCKTL